MTALVSPQLGLTFPRLTPASIQFREPATAGAPEMNPDAVLAAVAARIEHEGLSRHQAAQAIGVTANSLQKHLAGDHVRSDSVAKYRLWLEPSETLAKPGTEVDRRDLDRPPLPEDAALAAIGLPTDGRTGRGRELVVDMFSGCGGMSSGFEVLGGGTRFSTVLAMDIEDAMVRAFNANHRGAPVCRKIDVSQFLNRAEVLGFFLDHLASLKGDAALRTELDEPRIGLGRFLAVVRALDDRFLNAIKALRDRTAFREAYSSVQKDSLRQTSVIGFHDQLHLPRTRATPPTPVPEVVWGDAQRQPLGNEEFTELWQRPRLKALVESNHDWAKGEWSRQVDALAERSSLSGSGQLQSSARKIQDFLHFLKTSPMLEVRDLWCAWTACRVSLRSFTFGRAECDAALVDVYDRPARRVGVLLGGPPCQGFSRIGRGKIRALREAGVQVHEDGEAGDARNLLLHKYVLFVASLRPKVFLFENVRHFQTEVQTPEGVFQATEVLAEAIDSLADGDLHYDVSSRTVWGTHHLIPQTRERFVMAGVRRDISQAVDLGGDEAAWLLHPTYESCLPLSAALEGLPEPIGPGKGALARQVPVDAPGASADSAVSRYQAWLRQPSPDGVRTVQVDSHVARLPRSDDSELFRLMGPGRRWMDYRCDETETLGVLQRLLEAVGRLVEGSEPSGERAVAIDELRPLLNAARSRVDGSLSLRLLLEGIPPLPGELRHHLITPNYLKKRDGNNGDWLSRMDPTRPSKTIVQHMGKDTYAYGHPYSPRMLSVREAARIQTFPDWFSFACLSMVDAFRVIGNAVPPLLSNQLAERVSELLTVAEFAEVPVVGDYIAEAPAAAPAM